MTDPFRLDGRTVIVTGASRGIGAEVARAVVGQGGAAVLVARSKGALDEREDLPLGELPDHRAKVLLLLRDGVAQHAAPSGWVGISGPPRGAT